MRAKTSLVYVKTHKTGSSTLTNILHRFAIKHRVRPVLPRNNIFLGYPSATSLPGSFVPLPGKVRPRAAARRESSAWKRVVLTLSSPTPSVTPPPFPHLLKETYDMLVSAHSIYDRKGMDKLVPNAFYITLLRDPAIHFQSSWNYWHTSEHIERTSGVSVTMEQFLDDPVRLRRSAVADACLPPPVAR